MQQPLAHIYFITVFHHLLSNDFDLAGLVRVASSIATVRETIVIIIYIVIIIIIVESSR